MLRKILFATMLAIGASAYGQGFDEGVAPTRTGPEVESGQFEYAAVLTDQQLLQMNDQAKGLTRELLDIDLQLRGIDEMLAGHDRGNFLIFVGGFRKLETEANLRAMLATGQATEGRDAFNPFVLEGLDPDLHVSAIRAESSANAATLRDERLPLFRRRVEILSRLANIRRIVMADADRPGQAYDPNASYEEEPGPDFAWDTRTRIYGIECFGGAQYEVYTDHYGLNGQYVGTDRRAYDAVRAPLVASGAPFCGAWETRREETRKGS